MPLHYNRTAVVDGTASVHHRLAFMMGCFMDCRAVMDRAAFVYSRSVMSGTAFVHHRLCLVLWCFMYSRPVMGRAALVHHRLRLVMLCAPVHARTLLFGNVLVNGRALMSGIASMQKEVLKKLVISAIANIFCNFLCIIMIILRFGFCRTYFRNELMSGLFALYPPASALHLVVSGISRRIFLLAVS